MTDPESDRVIVLGAGRSVWGGAGARALRRAEHADREARRHLVASEDPQLQHADDGDRAGLGAGRLQAPAQHRHARRDGRARSASSRTRDRRGVRHDRVEGLRGTRAGRQPGEPVMSSQELIEEILLDAVRATGTGRRPVRDRSDAARARRQPTRTTSAALEVVDRATRRDARRSRGAALVAADGAASLIRSELGLELEGPQEPVAHRQLLLPRRHRAAPRRPQGRAVLRRQRARRAACCSRSTAPAAGSARSASRRTNGRSTCSPRSARATGSAPPSASTISSPRFCRSGCGS